MLRYACVALCIVPLTLFAFDYDLIIIGAGTTGLHAAITAHSLGKRCALIEKNSAQNVPSFYHDSLHRALMLIARHTVVHKNPRAHDILVDDRPIMHRKHLLQSMLAAYKDPCTDELYQKNIPIFYADPYFVDQYTIQVNNKILHAQKFLIAAGSHTSIPNIPNMHAVSYVVKDTLFTQNGLPDSIILFGNTPYIVELASALHALDCSVHIVTDDSLLLPMFDYEIIHYLTTALMQQGINILCNITPYAIDQNSEGVHFIGHDRAGSAHTFRAHSIFFDAEHVPNTASLSLEKAGIKCTHYPCSSAIHNPAKTILTKLCLQTSVHNIYACGSVIGDHVSENAAIYQAIIAVHNMFETQEEPIFARQTHIPKIISTPYGDVASIGLTEQEARKKYPLDIIPYHYHFGMPNTHYMPADMINMIKIICNKQNIVLGVHIIGSKAESTIDCFTIGKTMHEIVQNIKNKKNAPIHYHALLTSLLLACDGSSNTNKHDAPAS